MALDLEAFKKTQVSQSRAAVPEVLEDLRALAPRVLLDEDWAARSPEAPKPSEMPPGDRPQPKASSKMLLCSYQVLHHSSSQGQPGKMRSTP